MKKLTAEEILNPDYVLWFFDTMAWLEELPTGERYAVIDGFDATFEAFYV